MATLTFKTQAYLDKQTAEFCERAFGVRRWVWNWALAYYKTQKRLTGKSPTWQSTLTALRKAVNEEQDEYFKYLVDAQVTTKVWDEVCKDLELSIKQAKDANREANKRYLRNLHKKPRYKNGRKIKQKRNKLKKISPKFKDKKSRVQTFSIYHTRTTTFSIDDLNHLSFTKYGRGNRGTVKIQESFEKLKDCDLNRMTIKKDAGKYYICISYEKPNPRKACMSGKLGIDLGAKKSVVSYDGSDVKTISFNTDRSRKYDRLSKKTSNSLARKQKGSKRYEKAVLLCEKRAKRAADIREYLLEKTTSYLAQNYSEIKVDDFSFDGAKTVADRNELYRCMKFEFKQRLEEKAAETGCAITYVEHQKGEKTTSKCSKCGSEKHIIKNNNRTIKCSSCGFEIDRDENAAINAFNLLK